MNSSTRVEFRVVSGGGNPFDILDRNDLDAGAGPDGETSGVGIGERRQGLSFFISRGGQIGLAYRLGLLLEVLDAEVQITPEEEEGGGLDTGFEQFDRIGRGK